MLFRSRLDDWAHVLYSQAILTLGARIDDPAAFVSRLNELLVSLAAEPGGGVAEAAEPAGERPASAGEDAAAAQSEAAG